ncbi:MFS transporter [Flavobacterium sp. RHBU_3]|uniref:MFS transporter n=1 Tax=Flavobacterium sp. RHBU_3 TaxID=3391184 RepID=UPI0039852C2F
MEKTPHPIYNLQFGLMCLSSLLFSASFNMLIPELPAYLTSLGGAEYKGLIIALFTLTAGISRPFSGRLTDTVGRIPVMAVGSIVCFVCGLLYPVLTSVAGFLFLRLMHGFSTGFKPTATAAYVADIAPKERWGEALGIHGLCFSTGMAAGPALGGLITLHFSINVLFYVSSGLALLSVLIIMNMKETLKENQKFTPSLLKINRRDIILKAAVPAAFVNLLICISYGAMLTLVPDESEALGIKNKGMFFMVLTLTSLAMRFLAGKASDKYGRVTVLRWGLVVLFIALVLTGIATTKLFLLFAAGVYGIAQGILSPAINAWMVDLSSPEHRGKAVATGYMAMETGIGFGAAIAGWYYANDLVRIPMVFYFAAFAVVIAIVYTMMWQRRNKAVV